MTSGEGRAVLLVEDDPAIRDMVGEALHDEGYEVVEAPDGGAAIAALREHSSTPDALCLVILDMMLPVADGVQVLAVSADRWQLRRAAEAGADATLPKPFDRDRLLAVAERNCGPLSRHHLVARPVARRGRPMDRPFDDPGGPSVVLVPDTATCYASETWTPRSAIIRASSSSPTTIRTSASCSRPCSRMRATAPWSPATAARRSPWPTATRPT